MLKAKKYVVLKGDWFNSWHAFLLPIVLWWKRQNIKNFKGERNASS